MKKRFKVTVASRYMYDDYREYDIYTVDVLNITNAERYVKRVLTHWNKTNQCVNYELFDIAEM